MFVEATPKGNIKKFETTSSSKKYVQAKKVRFVVGSYVIVPAFNKITSIHIVPTGQTQGKQLQDPI